MLLGWLLRLSAWEDIRDGVGRSFLSACATVKAFAESGAAVVLADINTDALRTASEEFIRGRSPGDRVHL